VAAVCLWNSVNLSLLSLEHTDYVWCLGGQVCGGMQIHIDKPVEHPMNECNDCMYILVLRLPQKISVNYFQYLNTFLIDCCQDVKKVSTSLTKSVHEKHCQSFSFNTFDTQSMHHHTARAKLISYVMLNRPICYNLK